MSVVEMNYDFGDHGHPEWMKYEESLINENNNDSSVEDGCDNESTEGIKSQIDFNTEDMYHYEQIKNAARLWPHKLHGEGHFVALLRKNEMVCKDGCCILNIPSNVSGSSKKKKVQQNNMKANKKVDLPEEF